MDQLCGWSRDVDWGNAPSWIAALTALVVGAFTIINVQTARKAYVRGKWTGDVATARLVWAVVTKSGTIEKGDPVPKVDADTSFAWNSHVTTGEDKVTRANQRSVYCVVEVTNNSGEPIGDIETRVYDASGQEIVGFSNIYKVLKPGGTRTTSYLSPAPKNYGWSVLYSSIRFRDSAGLVWWRTDTSPPARDEDKVASKAYTEKQAEKLQRSEQRQAEFKQRRRAKRREAARAKKAAEQQSGARSPGPPAEGE